MKKLSLIISILLLNSLSLTSQTVTGKVVNSKGEGLGGLTVQLYINPNVYTNSSGTDGTFVFENITSVEDKILPEGYAISNNYPNPFNPKTRFNISIPKTSVIQIEIFNVIGERVLDNIERTLNTGENFIDVEMNGLPNGVYFSKISIDNKYKTIKKLMLLYGTQHLQGTFYRGDNSTPDYAINKSSLSKQIDSLVITGSGIKNNSFYNLPELTESNLDLGNLTLNTTLTGIPCPGMPTISYEGKTYNTVQIGNQCWIKENLDVGVYVASINIATAHTDVTNNGIIEKYCYENNEANCKTYGGLYDWNEAMEYVTTPGTKGICPSGWHIPTYSELQTLVASVNNDGNALKEIGQGTGSGAGTNTSGFSALVVGFRRNNGYFNDLEYDTYFWSSTEGSATDAFYLGLYIGNSNVIFYDYYKEYGFSVRCLKD